MKLNLGCGFRRLDGYLNVDISEACHPDRVVDLESLPWPFEESSASEIALFHVLEHLGADSGVFLGIMKELHRVGEPGALLKIVLPHPHHDDFLIDPTHVRPIMPETFLLFSKAKNREWQKKNVSNTLLALYLDVDFEMVSSVFVLDEPWHSRLERKEIGDEEIREALVRHNNVVKQFECVLRVIKD
jgi:hypothetical protein